MSESTKASLETGANYRGTCAHCRQPIVGNPVERDQSVVSKVTMHLWHANTGSVDCDGRTVHPLHGRLGM